MKRLKVEEEDGFYDSKVVEKIVEIGSFYDSKIIYESAEYLYRRGKQLIFAYTIIGIIIGVILGSLIGNIFSIIVSMIFLGVIGYLIGEEGAFWCKLIAQIALCQVKIEENTSKTSTDNKIS